MRVCSVRLAMRGPTGMAEAEGFDAVGFFQDLFEVADSAACFFRLSRSRGIPGVLALLPESAEQPSYPDKLLFHTFIYPTFTSNISSLL
jgi:hypothetical protein